MNPNNFCDVAPTETFGLKTGQAHGVYTVGCKGVGKRGRGLTLLWVSESWRSFSILSLGITSFHP